MKENLIAIQALAVGGLCAVATSLLAEIQPSTGPIEPTWESMAANYSVPEWFVDGKFGVWMHWGVPSSTDENRPNDGSHYGRRMYGPNDGEVGGQLKMTEELTAFHTERYGHPSEFGYEDDPSIYRRELGPRCVGSIL
jgi:hypothetical protein